MGNKLSSTPKKKDKKKDDKKKELEEYTDILSKECADIEKIELHIKRRILHIAELDIQYSELQKQKLWLTQEEGFVLDCSANHIKKIHQNLYKCHPSTKVRDSRVIMDNSSDVIFLLKKTCGLTLHQVLIFCDKFCLIYWFIDNLKKLIHKDPNYQNVMEITENVVALLDFEKLPYRQIRILSTKDCSSEVINLNIGILEGKPGLNTHLPYRYKLYHDSSKSLKQKLDQFISMVEDELKNLNIKNPNSILQIDANDVVKEDDYYYYGQSNFGDYSFYSDMPGFSCHIRLKQDKLYDVAAIILLAFYHNKFINASSMLRELCQFPLPLESLIKYLKKVMNNNDNRKSFLNRSNIVLDRQSLLQQISFTLEMFKKDIVLEENLAKKNELQKTYEIIFKFFSKHIVFNTQLAFFQSQNLAILQAEENYSSLLCLKRT